MIILSICVQVCSKLLIGFQAQVLCKLDIGSPQENLSGESCLLSQGTMVLSASVDTQSWPLSGYNSKSSALKVRKSTAKGISQRHLAALSLPRRAATKPASDSPAPNSKTVKGLESAQL